MEPFPAADADVPMSLRMLRRAAVLREAARGEAVSLARPGPDLPLVFATRDHARRPIGSGMRGRSFATRTCRCANGCQGYNPRCLGPHESLGQCNSALRPDRPLPAPAGERVPNRRAGRPAAVQEHFPTPRVGYVKRRVRKRRRASASAIAMALREIYGLSCTSVVSHSLSSQSLRL